MLNGAPPAEVDNSAGPPPGRWAQAIERLRRSPVAFPLAVLVAGAMLAISELGYRQSSGQLDSLVRMGRDRLELTKISRSITDAETNQRGYLLTGRADHLGPYRQARDELEQRQQTLEANYLRRGRQASLAELRKLRTLIDDKFVEMQLVIDLHDQGRHEAALSMLQFDRGGELMRGIRSQIDTLLESENQAIGAGIASVFDTLMLNRIGVASMSAISLLVLGMYLRQRRTNDLQQDEQQRLIQAERDRLEAQVQLRTQELTELTRHLETAREDERARLARELHDELGALLTAAKLDVARMRPKMQQDLPDQMPRLAHLVETLNSGIALKRRIIEDLRPSTLSNLGLKAALEILCNEFADRSGLPVAVAIEALPLSPSAELTAFRLVQESFTNIGKYANARQVSVSLDIEDSWAHLVVRDDGDGFDTRRMGLKKHGLVGMRYRVEAEQGRLVVDSAPGRGTAVQAWLPMTL
ncbi:CHASE3 domain-containing protein [Aquabacterium sp. OR-4]|uniref:CHASE3 domain-containing protein n=1 Tax=Aquabacterium sp. OR-4 TaxID=2978127 RepID=UPI0021B324D7|nr:CHASE3 domain-containing protein [Aquabacterium sp. OR-4]MDT7835033.1 CHASE3 domain-containing protein [Aquabacterium sp. OR-4]